jgi:hypothetical protein
VSRTEEDRHEYLRVEIDRVLAIVERDLPPLERAIDQLLGEWRVSFTRFTPRRCALTPGARRSHR